MEGDKMDEEFRSNGMSTGVKVVVFLLLAAIVIGVPCSSEPETRMARSPLIRRNRV